jgi:hypothetical protein
MRASAIAGLRRTWVEQGGFAGVGVTHQRHGRQRDALPLTALNQPRAPHGLEAFFNLRDPQPDLPAVDFQLRLARTAGADAAPEARHRHALASQPRQQVLQLSQFHLQLALARPGPFGEDIENQLRPVHHARIQPLFDVPQLGGGQFIVENDQIGPSGRHRGRQFVELALADHVRRIGHIPNLGVDIDDLSPGAGRQRSQLVERLLGGESPLGAAPEFDAYQNGLLRQASVVARVRVKRRSATAGIPGKPPGPPPEAMATDAPCRCRRARDDNGGDQRA